MSKTRLPLHEWLAVISIIAIFFSFLGAIVFQRDTMTSNSDSPVYTTSQEIEVSIEGSVDKPGTYKMLRSNTVGDLLARAVLRSDADVRRLKLDRPLKDGQHLRIKQLPIKKTKS